MSNNFITVFTPVYNRGYCVRNVYESLLKQKYNNFEWLVINDGSVDNTEDVIKECMEEGKIIIRYFYQSNGGQHRALNSGIEKAKGNLLMIVDSDDYLTEDSLYWINYYENTIEDKQNWGGVSGLRRHEDGSVIGYKWSLKSDYIDTLNTERYRYKELLCDKAEAYYTDVLRKFAPIPEFENENDVEKGVLWNRIAKAGYKVRWFNKKIYVCEYLDDGMSKNIVRNYLKNYNGYTLYEKEHIHLNIGIKDKIRSTLKYYEISKIKGISDVQIARNIEISLYQLKVIKVLSANKRWIKKIVYLFKKPIKL